MVIILDGAQVRNNLCYLNCLRNLIRSRAATNHIFFLLKYLLSLHMCATRSELPSNINTMEKIKQYDYCKFGPCTAWKI